MATKGLKRRAFITFEGTEGCGKSTQSRLLYEYLRKKGCDCIHTREPGGTQVGERIRQVLLHSKDVRISDLTELFLFEAARAQIVQELVLPNLKKGKIVICDRFTDATVSYQGYGGRISLKVINFLNKIATDGLKPDITILLDIDIKTGLAKAKSKGSDRMELKDMAYHKRVRNGYLALARKEPRRIRIVRVEKTILETQAKIREAITKLLNDK
jgi:dTMP kinase